MKYLIVCLGNIGAEYKNTRHNVGFLVADYLAQKYDIEFEQDRLAFSATLKYAGRQIHLIKPTTFMNLSGKALSYWKQKLGVPAGRILIVTDDLALPLGKLRLKLKGSPGGHNGLKDVERALGSSKYPRLRFGIGDDFGKGRQIDYVLGEFTPQETSVLETQIPLAADAVLDFCRKGPQEAMNIYNKN